MLQEQLVKSAVISRHGLISLLFPLDFGKRSRHLRGQTQQPLDLFRELCRVGCLHRHTG